YDADDQSYALNFTPDANFPATDPADLQEASGQVVNPRTGDPAVRPFLKGIFGGTAAFPSLRDRNVIESTPRVALRISDDTPIDGDEITVEVLVNENVQTISSYALQLSWDPSVIEGEPTITP